ncbi:T9SS type A sorting domain-containing protein [Aggregatimonas sangjinii]|uniref:T9SS type A sorting domain-containing protein n=1 Tax=Aggregatimonas sangjinii TaxID=2583587 RepID=A0A5B7SNI2_9FLAO|nr:T9SS type A sorting domain-containing protein [Aggregatimonas sangjinii]QCW98599.1 T9SS type A sorting domain-containing protein [Aggregatimonas sangjinii]
MNKPYFLICLCFISFSYAQESGTNGDIDGFKLYPNPVTDGKVYINTAANAPKDILIFDVMGTQVLQTTILGSDLNLSDLDAGIYVLRVFEKDKVATRKLIIK